MEREATGEVVSAEVREEIAHPFQLIVKIDRRNASRRTGSLIAIDGYHQRGTMKLLRDSPRRESDHSAVPVFAGEHEDAWKRVLSAEF